MNRGDLADLSAFVAVADRSSFALQLGVTPSALSHSMRQLGARRRGPAILGAGRLERRRSKCSNYC
jgi:hypothetical protein